MKARVKATGEIVDINPTLIDDYDFVDNKGVYYTIEQLELIHKSIKPIKKITDPDYWTRLEHQYAGMAMQGLMSYIEQVTPTKGCSYCDAIVDFSVAVAHALVEKLKDKEERK